MHARHWPSPFDALPKELPLRERLRTLDWVDRERLRMRVIDQLTVEVDAYSSDPDRFQIFWYQGTLAAWVERFVEGSPEQKRRVSESLYRKLHFIEEIEFLEDKNLTTAFDVARFLEDKTRVRERLAAGYLTQKGETDPLLTKAFLNDGTDDQAREMVRIWTKAHQGAFLKTLEQDGAFLRERLAIVERAYRLFAARHDLPLHIPRALNVQESGCLLIHQAIQVVQMGYDLAIGVPNSAIHFAALLEFFGQPTRYLEWHRRWQKRPPIWRKIGSDRRIPTQAQKILVCEVDAHSGRTLDALQGPLARLHPEQVDILFQTDYLEKNAACVAARPFYHSQRLLNDLSLEGFPESLELAASYAAKWLAHHEVG